MPATRLRFSFKQWLLVALLLMTCLFAASSLIGLKTLDYLTRRSQETAANAVELNAKVQELNDAITNMERFAKQYPILYGTLSNSRELLQSYQTNLANADSIMQMLLVSGAIKDDVAQHWHVQTGEISQALSDVTTGASPITSIQDRLDDEFNTLISIQTQINDMVRLAIEQHSQTLLQDITRRQHWISQLMLCLFILAFGMALAFGLWLARPFKRIEAAIVRLGENQFDTPIDIRGPEDVRKLGQRLDWLRMRLAEIDADKARFLRHTSHELKTPLAALREGIALLQEELTGTLNSSQKDVVSILAQNAITLQHQIEDLLRFNAAAFDARKLTRKPTNLLELAEDVVDAQQLQWQALGLDVEVTGEAVIIDADPEKLSTALSNLLSNAIRFSPPQGHIVIHIGTQGDRALIDVKDEGPGIAPEDAQHIFEPFYRGRIQPEHVTRGTGIGLSIVQEYVAAHGGRVELINASSNADQNNSSGTQFRIELPYAHPL